MNPERPIMWPTAEWREPVATAAVDDVATARFRSRPKVVRVGDTYDDRHDWNVPWHVARVPAMRKVWEAKRPGWFPSRRAPVPQHPRVVGGPDPAQAVGADAQLFVIDPDARRYWELSSFGPAPFWAKWLAGLDWRAGRVAEWRLDEPWDTQHEGRHPIGITGARIPLAPLVPSYEELESGRIGHALFVSCGLDDVRPEHVGYARSSDGHAPDGVIRQGDRLRLSPEAAARKRNEATTAHDHALVNELETGCGAVVADITSPHADKIRAPQDRRVRFTVEFSRQDFVVLT